MSPAMQVGFVQYRASTSKATSLQELVALTREAARRSDLVVLPEMAATRYLFDGPEQARKLAEPARGETFRSLARVASESGCWIVAGFVEDAGADLYNSAMVLDGTGDLRFTYRKTLLYPSDERWARRGDSGYRAFDTGRLRFGVGICMDLNDDGFLRWVEESALDVLAFPTKWLDEGEDVWPYWMDRMSRSGAALVAANGWGSERDVRFSGRSVILRGNAVLASSPAVGNAVGRAETGP